jgi:tartronate-semialdehyde synthase
MRMPAMDAVVSILEHEGVEYVFGVPGGAILPLYKALSKSAKIRHLAVRHEEGGTHAADGYARASGKIGIMIGTSGPGATNMITGLYTCMADSIPIICITGQAALPTLHKEAFQAVDIVSVATPVTKWAVQAKSAAQLPGIFRTAFQIARSGRPGPVLIDLPIDVSTQQIEYDADLDEALPIEQPRASYAHIRRAVELLLQAERPMIMPGGGVISADAAIELQGLADYLQIPVTPTLMGKGSIPDDHPLYAGVVGIQTQQRFANALFLESDCILAIGARFADRHTGPLDVYRGNRTFIHVDIEPTQIGKVFEPDLGIVSHAKLALADLLEVAKQMTPARTESRWTDRVHELRSSLRRKLDFADVPIKPQRVFQEMNAWLPHDACVVTAIGLHQIWSGQFQTTYTPRSYFVCGQAGPLGWVVPACTGVKLGQPHKTVVGVVGDYSFHFLLAEVAVAAHYHVPFVIVMINNGYMGLIRQSELAYEMNYAVDITFDNNGDDLGIDHIKAMEALGGLARRVTMPDEIGPALEWAMRTAEEWRLPVLVEVLVERETNAAMGTAINTIKEWEAVEDLPMPTAAMSTQDIVDSVASHKQV